MDITHSLKEGSTANLIPIKSSMSVILGDTQVWSNTVCASADFMQKTLNSIADTDKLDVFAKKLAEKHSTKKDVALKSENRKKKSRQVFTYSQPPVAGIVADFTGKDIEVYESVGGQDIGLFCGMEPHLREEIPPRQVCQHQQVLKSCIGDPDPDIIQTLGSDEITHRSPQDASVSEISFPQFTLPLEVRSEGNLKTCFTIAEKPNLFYTVSESSLPILKRSSLIFSRMSSQRMTLPCHQGLREHLAIHPHDFIPKNGSFPSCLKGLQFKRASYNLTLGRSYFVDPQCKDIMLKWKNMDESLARRIAETIQKVTDKAQHGKFMSYAKFNSSFKLSEVFYEDINSRNLSHVPSLARSFQLSGFIHKVNPDFDENQSISEAMTAVKSFSSIISTDRITKVCRPAFCPNSETAKNTSNCEWLDFISPMHISNYSSCKLNPNPTRAVEFSSISTDSDVLFTEAVSTARKLQLLKLQDTLRSTFQRDQKETDIWSSSTSAGLKELRASPKRLVDVISPSCIFRSSLIEKEKRPVWQLKSDNQDANHNANLAEFIFKAHDYLRGRDHRNSHRCFFPQQPTYRLVDEGVQFPEVALTWDRPPNLKEPPCEKVISKLNLVDAAPQDHSHPTGTVDSVDEEPAKVLQLATNDNCPAENQIQPHSKNLNVIIACDKPFYSTSEIQTASAYTMSPSLNTVTKMGTESSIKLPGLESSNKCQFTSSEYPTTVSFQTKNKKPIKSKLESTAKHPIKSKLDPVVERPVSKHCKMRSQRLPGSNKFCRSYRAFCDHRKIQIKYENGRYTVLKEKDRSERQTVWSTLTGKAVHLLNSVVYRKP